MGTDIHGRLQFKYGDRWLDEGPIENGRNYKVFAVLADVRNGHGFAGVETHRPITPISPPRGWPEDFHYKDPYDGYDEEKDADPDHSSWLGDHSFSWLTLDEISDYPYWDEPLLEVGYFSREEYEDFLASSKAPATWSGDIWGGNIIKADAEQEFFPEGWTHVRVRWARRTLGDACKTFLLWTKYAQSKDWSGEGARIVFGFDS